MGQRHTARRPGAINAGGRTRHRRRAVGLGCLLSVATALGTLLLARLTLQAWPGAGPVAADTALLTVSLTAAAGLMGWVAVTLALAALTLIRSHHPDLHAPSVPPRPGPTRPLTAPRAVSWVSATLVAVTAAPATASLAGPPEPTWSSVGVDAPVSVAAPGSAEGGHRSASEPGSAPDAELPLLPDGSVVPLPGWTPAPVMTPATPSTGVGLVSAAPRADQDEVVVVRRGDSLWSIAARHLGSEATVQDVAEAWPRWYAANRNLIGPDPDLILPGQELAIPGPAPAGQDAGTDR